MPEKVEKKEVAKGQPSATSDSNLLAAIAEFFGLVVVIPVLIYLVKKEDSFVRFHAMQATVLGIIYWIVLGLWAVPFVLISTTWIGALLGCLIFPVIGVFVIAALFLAWNAYQGERYKLPVIGDFAERHS